MEQMTLEELHAYQRAQEQAKEKGKKKSKYNNKTCYYNGIEFDSKKERDYYIVLREKELNGEITDLRMQVPFVLLEAIKDTRRVPRLKRLVRYEEYTVQDAVRYFADFVYTDADGNEVVVDVKSPATRKKDAYILKKKMMRSLLGITIKEV